MYLFQWNSFFVSLHPDFQLLSKVVDRRLSDYEQLEVLHGARHHVLLVKLNNRLSVLKVCITLRVAQNDFNIQQ